MRGRLLQRPRMSARSTKEEIPRRAAVFREIRKKAWFNPVFQGLRVSVQNAVQIGHTPNGVVPSFATILNKARFSRGPNEHGVANLGLSQGRTGGNSEDRCPDRALEGGSLSFLRTPPLSPSGWSRARCPHGSVSRLPPPNRACSRVGRRRVASAGTFPTAPPRTARESFDLKQLSSDLCLDLVSPRSSLMDDLVTCSRSRMTPRTVSAFRIWRTLTSW
jgi:hypothetical protein